MNAAAVRPFFLTTVGKKYVMAITGIIWAGFVFTHMAANMLILISSDKYNQYGHALTSNGLLYIAEAGLVAALVVHVLCAISLTIENKKARGDQRYAMTPNGDKGASFASKTMAIQGALILVFVIMHLATFKFGTYYQTTVEGVNMRDLHRLVVEVFRQPGYVVWYIISLILLGFHLSHGVGSIFQSLGVRNDRMAVAIRRISVLYAIVVAGGFISQPFYVYFIAG